jgi:hypothetical protein
VLSLPSIPSWRKPPNQIEVNPGQNINHGVLASSRSVLSESSSRERESFRYVVQRPELVLAQVTWSYDGLL